MSNLVRKIDLDCLRTVLKLRTLLGQTGPTGFAVLGTELKNKEFPFRNQIGYGPKCSGYSKPAFGKTGCFDASGSIAALALSANGARHTLPTGVAWLKPQLSGPCVPMFQTKAAYETWLATDGTCRQNSPARRADAVRITREVAEACLA